jgi:phosphonopyruvate decarboxylase
LIKAQNFIEAAREMGFKHYTGVPCSFLTPFINYVIDDNTLDYVASANEGDALATAAGAALGGKRSIVMMQNSGLGNAVSPITSLTYIFHIPVLIITTHRGAPGLKDEPQHELMGKITGELFDTMQVPWETFPDEEQQIVPALQRALDYMQQEHRPYAFIMQKGTVEPYSLTNRTTKDINVRSTLHKNFDNDQDTRPARYETLKRIVELTPESGTILIATTGYTGRELFSIADRPNHIYMVGSMGCASSLGLGLALARPDLHVIIIDGDGAALMRMGNFATIGTYAGTNLTHILLDNEVHDSTGAQATVSANVTFAKIAEACGYAVAFEGDDISLINDLFVDDNGEGPRFGHLKIRAGTIDDLPRPDISPREVLRRTMQNIGSQF